MLTESRIALYSQASTLPLALSVRLWVIQAFLHSRLLNPIRRRWRKENEDISRTVKSKTKEVKQLPLTIDWKRLHTLIDHSRYRKGISLKPLQRVRLTRREERREEWVGIWKARQRKWALTRISVLWRCFPLNFWAWSSGIVFASTWEEDMNLYLLYELGSAVAVKTPWTKVWFEKFLLSLFFLANPTPFTTFNYGISINSTERTSNQSS